MAVLCSDADHIPGPNNFPTALHFVIDSTTPRPLFLQYQSFLETFVGTTIKLQLHHFVKLTYTLNVTGISNHTWSKVRLIDNKIGITQGQGARVRRNVSANLRRKDIFSKTEFHKRKRPVHLTCTEDGHPNSCSRMSRKWYPNCTTCGATRAVHPTLAGSCSCKHYT